MSCLAAFGMCGYSEFSFRLKEFTKLKIDVRKFLHEGNNKCNEILRCFVLYIFVSHADDISRPIST